MENLEELEMDLTGVIDLDNCRNSIWSTSRIVATLLMTAIMGFFIAPGIFGHSYSVAENDKRAVWRIENPEGRYGTGFALKDSVAGILLVTNKHMVKSLQNGHYFDSIKVYRNIITKGNKVSSSDSSWTLLLRYKGRDLFVEHDSSDVDLIFIRIGNFTIGNESLSNPVGFDSFSSWSTKVIADTRLTEVNDGARIQMIGYSFKLPQKAQFPSSRFGDVSNYAAEHISINIDGKIRKSQWIIVDASVRGGHSGGPAFFVDEQKKKLLLVGFVQAVVKELELTFIIPSHYILELLDKAREKIK